MTRRPRLAVITALLLALGVVGAGIADPGLALSLAPALLLLALLARGIRPGERLIDRWRERFSVRKHARAVSMPRPRLAVVVRPAGRLLASALAMRPPPHLAQ